MRYILLFSVIYLRKNGRKPVIEGHISDQNSTLNLLELVTLLISIYAVHSMAAEFSELSIISVSHNQSK